MSDLQLTIFTVLMPIGLGIIMLGLGLTLKVSNFIKLYKQPKAIIIGLCLQMIVMPIIIFSMLHCTNFNATIFLGFMLLVAVPGGPSSNLFSHLSHGDVALNIVLTAINSLLSIIFIPIIVNGTIQYLDIQDLAIPLQFSKVIEIFLIVVIPMGIGILLNHRYPSVCAKFEKLVKIASSLFLTIIIITAIISQGYLMKEYWGSVGLFALVMNVSTLLISYFVPMLFAISNSQRISISLESGIHNATLAIFIALNAIKNLEVSIPSAMYGIIMFFTAAIFSKWFLTKHANT